MRRGIEIARGLSRRGLRGRGIGSGLAEKDLADVGSAENLASRARDLDPSRNQNVGPVGHTERLECLLLDQQHSRPRLLPDPPTMTAVKYTNVSGYSHEPGDQAEMNSTRPA